MGIPINSMVDLSIVMMHSGGAPQHGAFPGFRQLQFLAVSATFPPPLVALAEDLFVHAAVRKRRRGLHFAWLS
jgi:hypothetical protein